MMKTRIIFTLLVLTIIVAPLTANPSAMALDVGPVPIPGNLLPIPGTTGTPLPPAPLPTTTVPMSQIPPLYTVNKVQSGLVVADSLTNDTQNKDQLLADQTFWHYGGSATVENSPFDIFKDQQGFHIGVQALSNGNWAGYYGVAPSSNAVLYHAIVTTQVATIPGDFYENGLYVQTANGNVSYVTCYSDTSSFGTVWAIVSATGGTGGASHFTVLWADSTPGQPLTRDCTIITNGSNYLKVYLDGNMVYTSNTLDLQMPGPFIAFLEPQTSYAGQMLYGTYKDYYSTTDENVQVTNTPMLAATVKIVDSTGRVLASSPVVSGAATLPVGQYHMPLAAYVKVYDANDIQLASTSSPVNIFGGDVYKVGSIPGL